MKSCCAEVIFGPKLSVDQNKPQGIQKVNLRDFKLNYLFGSLQICSAITMRSIKTLKVEAPEKTLNSGCLLCSKWPLQNVFYIMHTNFICHSYVSSLLLTGRIYIFEKVLYSLLTTLFVSVLNYQSSELYLNRTRNKGRSPVTDRPKLVSDIFHYGQSL